MAAEFAREHKLDLVRFQRNSYEGALSGITAKCGSVTNVKQLSHQRKLPPPKLGVLDSGLLFDDETLHEFRAGQY